MSETQLCPDCGATNPRDVEVCAECGHPMAAEFRPRRPVHERPERAPASVATIGYRPAGARGSGLPGWMWAGIGIAALAAVFVTALQIANAPKPIVVPNASGPQVALAESLSVLLHEDSTAVAPNVAMGNLMYDTGNFGLAIPYYTRALKGDPKLVDVEVDLAVSYHNSGEFETARQILEGVVIKAPMHAIALFDLGVVYQQLGRVEDARRVLLHARELAGPPEMINVIDQMIARIDGKEPSGQLPPGHPPMDGATGGMGGGAGGGMGGVPGGQLPPDHPPIDQAPGAGGGK